MFPSKQGISPFVPMLFSIFSFLLTFKCVQSCHLKHFLCGAGYWTQGPSTCWESVHLLNHSPSLLSILSHPLPPKSPVCCVLEMPATPPLLCLATMLSHSFAFPVTVPFKHPSISPCHYPSRLPSPACLLPHADSHWVNLCFLVRTTSSTKSKPRPVFKFFLQLFLFPGASRYSPDTYKELICPWASTLHLHDVQPLKNSYLFFPFVPCVPHGMGVEDAKSSQLPGSSMEQGCYWWGIQLYFSSVTGQDSVLSQHLYICFLVLFL